MLTEISGLVVFLAFCASMAALTLGGAFVIAHAIIGFDPGPKRRREKADPDTFTCSMNLYLLNQNLDILNHREFKETDVSFFCI